MARKLSNWKHFPEKESGLRKSNLMLFVSEKSVYQHIPLEVDKEIVARHKPSTHRPILPPELVYDHRLESLQKEVKALQKKIKSIEKSVASEHQKTIEFRACSFEEAKEEIAKYFLKNDGKEIGYEDLIENLRLDPEIVFDACNQLVKEGKIG